MSRLIHRLVIISIVFLASPRLFAQTAETDKIVSIVKVYTWNAKKGVWAEGQAIRRISRSLDAKGRAVVETLAGGIDDLLEKSIYAYDGDTVTVTVYGPDGGLRRTVTVEREGNLETETAVLVDGTSLFVNQRKYARSGWLAETRQGGPDGRLVYRKTYDYDDEGNLSSISVYNADGGLAFVIDYQYLKFDARRRWTARAEYYTYADVRRRPHEVVYRTFVKHGREK